MWSIIYFFRECLYLVYHKEIKILVTIPQKQEGLLHIGVFSLILKHIGEFTQESTTDVAI